MSTSSPAVRQGWGCDGQALVAEGARVVVSSRQCRRTWPRTVEALGPEVAEGVVADNADPETPDLLEAAWRRWGRIDGGLISVGGPPAASVVTTTDLEWEEAFRSVFLGAVRVARRLATSVGEGGSIAFVLSTSVKVPLTELATSNGLRPGLAMIAKELADEVGPAGDPRQLAVAGAVRDRAGRLARLAGRRP